MTSNQESLLKRTSNLCDWHWRKGAWLFQWAGRYTLLPVDTGIKPACLLLAPALLLTRPCPHHYFKSSKASTFMERGVANLIIVTPVPDLLSCFALQSHFIPKDNTASHSGKRALNFHEGWLLWRRTGVQATTQLIGKRSGLSGIPALMRERGGVRGRTEWEGRP